MLLSVLSCLTMNMMISIMILTLGWSNSFWFGCWSRSWGSCETTSLSTRGGGSYWQGKWYSWHSRAGFVLTWLDMIWNWYDLIWSNLIWFDVSFFDIIWFDLVWFEVSSLDWIIIQLLYSYFDNTLIIIIIIIMLPTIVRRRTYIRVIRLVC